MKVIYYIILIFAVLAISNNGVQAQTSVKKCNGKSYVFDYQNQKVFRQDLKRSATQKSISEHFSVKQKTSANDIYKEVLSKKRLQELKSNKVITSFSCNSNGQVKSVEFLFLKEPFFSVEEIEKLEKAFFNYKFDIQAETGEQGEYNFAIACFFSRLQ